MNRPSAAALRTRIRRHLADVSGGDTAFAVDLLETYLTSASDHIAALGPALEAGAPDRVLATVHALKSSSAYVGMIHLHALCQEVETALRQGAAGPYAVGQVDAIRRVFFVDRTVLEQEARALRSRHAAPAA